MDNATTFFSIGEKIVAIDAGDSDLLSLRWHITINGYTARMNLETYSTQFLHRTILERAIGRKLTEHEFTDHVNGRRLDNRRINLRVCSKLENCRNAKRYKNNTSGYKGVGWDKKSKKWRSRIKVNGELITLGRFDDPKDAYAAYCEAAKRYFGDFARLENIERDA